MQPHWGRGARELPLLGRDVIVLLDVSYSMLAEDAAAQPAGARQGGGRARWSQAVQRDGGHRLGLLAFAGRADVLCPLTRDYGLFLKRLEDASADAVAARAAPRSATRCARPVRALRRARRRATPIWCWSATARTTGACRSRRRRCWRRWGSACTRSASAIPSAARRSRSPTTAGRARLPGPRRPGGPDPHAQRPAGRHGGRGGRRLPDAARTAPAGSIGCIAEQIAGQPRRELAAAGEPGARRRATRSFSLLGDRCCWCSSWRSAARARRGRRRRGGRSGDLAPPAAVCAGLLALLPILGADQAEQAVREGNQLYEAGQYEAALSAYEAAAEALPESRARRSSSTSGNALFKNQRPGAGARPLSRRARPPRTRARRAAPSTTSA